VRIGIGKGEIMNESDWVAWLVLRRWNGDFMAF
jgi:hypothetical protein